MKANKASAAPRSHQPFKVGQAVVWKESAGKWGFKLTGGGLADGRKNGGTGRLLFTDGGKTYIVEGNTTLDGKPLLKLRDVYTRLDR